jgi:hypothetical protein
MILNKETEKIFIPMMIILGLKYNKDEYDFISTCFFSQINLPDDVDEIERFQLFTAAILYFFTYFIENEDYTNAALTKKVLYKQSTELIAREEFDAEDLLTIQLGVEYFDIMENEIITKK